MPKKLSHFFRLFGIILPLCLTTLSSHAALPRLKPIHEALAMDGKLFDPYHVLGVPKASNPADIKKAYLSKMMKYHPDRNAGLPTQNQEQLSKLYQKAQRSFELLKNRRNEVDTYLEKHPTFFAPPEKVPEATAVHIQKAIHQYQTSECVRKFGQYIDYYE